MNNLNYGVIGNCCTAALVSEKASIEWLCFPNFDSPSIFAALLDREKGGSFGFEVSEDYHTVQSYVPHTNILSTTFVSERDEFAVVDFMPCYELYDNKEYYRPAEVYRYIRWIKGRPRIRSIIIRLPTMRVARHSSTLLPGTSKRILLPTTRTGSISTLPCRCRIS